LQFQLTSFLQSSFPVTSHHIVRSRCQDLIVHQNTLQQPAQFSFSPFLLHWPALAWRRD
jgi:hypothetical protein